MKQIKVKHVVILSVIIWLLIHVTDMIYVVNLSNWGGNGAWIGWVYVYGKFAKWLIPIVLYLGLGVGMGKHKLTINKALILGLPIMFAHLAEEIITMRVFDFPFGFPRIILIPGLAYVFGLIIVGVSAGVILVLKKII